MSRRLGHPDPEALACFCAGMLSERRGRRVSSHVARCPRCAVTCARLDAVLTALATAAVPVLPSAAERRVISAIDAESGARASALSAARAPGALALAGSRVDSIPAGRPATAVIARVQAVDSHARRWARSWGARAGVTASLVAAIGGLGYLVRGAGPGSPAQAVSSSSAGAAPRAGGVPRGEAQPPGDSPHTTAFLVTDTGTRYRWSTLRAQVRDRLAAQAPPSAGEPIQPVITPAPSATQPAHSPPARTSGAARQFANPPAPMEVAPPKSLIGCVLHLTGNVPPKFVDLGTYQARPAYVFADAAEAWVVGTDCTAARPALITAVRLGNAH